MPDDPKQDARLDPREKARRRKFDEAYRKAYSNTRVIADFVLHFLPDTAGCYDLSTLHRVSGTFITRVLGKRFADMVWRIDVGEDGWPHVYLLFEFQSDVQRDMSMRTLEYSVCIWRALERKDRGPKGEYPPVIAAVPNTSERRWTAPTNVRELFGNSVPRAALPHLPEHRFVPFDLRWLDLGDPEPDNVAARLVGLEQAKSGAELDELAGRLVALLRKEGKKKLVGSIGPLIEQILGERLAGKDGRRPNFTYLMKGENDMNLLDRARAWGAERDQEWLEKGIAQGVAQGRTEGVAQGRTEGVEQGRAEGERKAVCRMAARRFGAEAAERLDRALGGMSDPAAVEAAADLVIECATVDELLAELARLGD